MATIELLRKVIREEVRAVFQAELAGILKEAIIANKGTKTIIEEQKPKKTTVPGTLNTIQPRVVAPNLGMNNPLNSLLAETANAMASENYEGMSFTSEDALGFGMMQPRETAVVDSVGDMVSSARASSNFDAIQINAVPDFTGLMSKLRANGEI
jgi:hypothetical protein